MNSETITSLSALEAALSRPSEADIACMQRLEGDILILGGSGKMGPSLARLCARAAEAAGTPRRVIAVSRNATPEPGIEAISCDLLDRGAVARLPQCPNVLYLVGRKFGSTADPEQTWAMNVLAPAIAAEHFRSSRIVAFSTGNVYALRPALDGGSRESDTPGPVGEYAQSCLGRERVFQYYSSRYGTPCLIYRLNYAVDLRYGVLVDIARRVQSGKPVSQSVPAFNVIWQRDANSYALRALEHCSNPPKILNVTGPETLRLHEVAAYYASRFHKPVLFEGEPGSLALLSDASECCRLLGKPTVGAQRLTAMVGDWMAAGGESIDKPTHFEVADGRF